MKKKSVRITESVQKGRKQTEPAQAAPADAEEVMDEEE